ncbi:cell wall hydrolase [Aureimonas sp. AU40]|uniref:cell wall hydrolase n=1 Tax=Aureimonas sp. AU40 TaxID=1637747 RepID=UPI000785EA0C|nr:cell wall hydrolase [Aureimonas sp. AU40]
MAVHARSRLQGSAPRRNGARARARLLASLPLALAVLPLFPAAIAMPPVPTQAELQASLPPEMADLSAFAEDGDDLDSSALAGPLYIKDPVARIPAKRGGRVAPTPLATVQAKFAAGRLVDPAGLLQAGIALGDENLRAAFAAPDSSGGAVLVAESFAPPLAPESPKGQIAAPKPDALRAIAALAPTPSSNDVAGSSVAAYAGTPRPGVSNLFDAVLGPSRGFIPPKGENDHSWVATPLPASSYTEEQQTCLAKAIYFEARGETEQGQGAVAQVVLNRVRNPAYPKTICGVVYQNQDWFGRCQFSFACDGIKDVIWNRPAYALAERIARQATNGEIWIPEVGSATHYHATYVHPRWAKTMEKVDKIGLHIFYRTFGGGWR